MGEAARVRDSAEHYKRYQRYQRIYYIQRRRRYLIGQIDILRKSVKGAPSGERDAIRLQISQLNVQLQGLRLREKTLKSQIKIQKSGRPQ